MRIKLTTLLLLGALASCTTITSPDGTTIKSVDPVATEAALVALEIYARKHAVNYDK
jgi:hypothetical protein